MLLEDTDADHLHGKCEAREIMRYVLSFSGILQIYMDGNGSFFLQLSVYVLNSVEILLSNYQSQCSQSFRRKKKSLYSHHQVDQLKYPSTIRIVDRGPVYNLLRVKFLVSLRTTFL